MTDMTDTAGMNEINVTTRRIRVENVIGEAMKQVNIAREITLPDGIKAKKLESIDTEIRDIEYTVIDNKIIVEFVFHKQVYYVECHTGDVQEFTLPDERVTEFIHLDGAMPDMDADVDVKLEYCDFEAIEMHHKHRGDGDDDADYDATHHDKPGKPDKPHDKHCHSKFQQTCILKIKAKVFEVVDIDVVTNVEGAGLTPTFQTVEIDTVVGMGRQQFTLSDEYIQLPEDERVKKIKNIDAEIQDIEKRILPGKVIIKGKLHKQIYYVVEPRGEVKEISADIPFTVFVPVEGAGDGGKVSVKTRIEYIDFELVKRGGLQYVKETVVIEVWAKVIDHITLSIVTAVEGAEVETRTLMIENIIGEACRQVNIKADIILPDEARKVAKVDAEIEDLESEVIRNKIIIKGVLHKQIYYVSAKDDQLREFTVNEPFTEFVHLDGAQEGDSVDLEERIEYVNVEARKDKPTKHWHQTAVLEICAFVTESQELTVVTAVLGGEVEPEPDCPPGTTFDYVVQKGDTLFTIAQAHGVSVNAILAVNPGITTPNIIYAGRTIQVPCPPGMG
ncbi:MAG: DUF3794 domain-containing protein [Clostridia bacterium]|jgi:hypothetical protein|nr:DUF3794 domain-containing protein [Clostridia bacterium]